jgi:hypothetical protein
MSSKIHIHIEDFARNRNIIDMSGELSRIINRKIPSLSTFLKYSNYIEALHSEKKGIPIPPPHVYKQKTVKQYAKLFSIMTFIETGTYRGEMVEAIKTTFDRIYSIELDSTLYETAKQRFSKSRSITIIKGDSGRVLPKLLKSIKSPCLFWLDAHYSSGITGRGELETPIMKELQCILSHSIKKHVILIDDARCFVGKNDYPTIRELKRFVFNINPDLVIKIENNIIRVHP